MLTVFAALGFAPDRPELPKDLAARGYVTEVRILENLSNDALADHVETFRRLTAAAIMRSILEQKASHVARPDMSAPLSSGDAS